MEKHTRFRGSVHSWHIEDNMAWFIDAQSDILCCLDLQLGECNCVAQIPNGGLGKSMLNTRCIKVNNEIFCMPCYGDRIWIYNTMDAVFQFIEIKNQDHVKLYMEFCWIHGDRIFAVSRALRQVIVLDTVSKEIEYYPINVRKEDTFLSCCVKVETKIYCTSEKSNRIYQFDMNSKETVVYNIPNVNENFALICFDGNKFWLSGYSKKIYIWDKDENIVQVIEQFPKQFGNYNFFNDTDEIIDYESEIYDTQLFCRLEAVGKYIWAIPYRTNAVLYIDKDTFEVHVLSVKNEEETKVSLLGRRKFKYFWQYLRDDRYIGILSLKNSYIIEIDTSVLKESPKNYFLSDSCLKLIWMEQVLYETDNMHKEMFERLVMLNEKNENIDGRQNGIGARIYSHLK